MFNSLWQNRSVTFLLITGLMTCVAVGAAIISALASQAGDYELVTWSSRVSLVMAVLIVLYVAPRLAQSIKLEYLRSDVTFQVPLAGWVFAGLVLVVTATAFLTGNNLLYLVMAVLLAALAVMDLTARFNLHNVGVSLRFPDHIFAGEAAPFDLTLTNRKRLLPSFSLAVELLELPGEENAAPPFSELAHVAFLPAGAQARLRVRRSVPKRGAYPVRGFLLRTRFPFGFLERRRLIEAPGELVVYPQPQPLDSFYHLLPLKQGLLESTTRGSGSDFYALRQYSRSDHRHHIDWKATAKTTRLMVREFTRDDDWRITIVLDTRRPAEASDLADKFERAITLAASLSKHFSSAGAEVRLVAEEVDTGYGGGQKHRYALLRELARLQLRTEEAASGAEKERLLAHLPVLREAQFKILLTPTRRGLLPAQVWQAAHVVYFDEL